MTPALVRQAREKLGLDAWGMAHLLGIGLRTYFRWEAEGIDHGPALVLLDLILNDELPARYVPQEDAQGRVYPITQ